MLGLIGTFVLFLLSIIISIPFEVKNLIKNSFNLIFLSSLIYTITSSAIILVVHFIENGLMWDYKSVLLTLAYSITISFLLKKLRIKSKFITYLIYYIVNVISFLVLTVFIADYGSGNNTIILYGAFTIAFIALSVIHFFIKKAFQSYDNDETVYKRQFD